MLKGWRLNPAWCLYKRAVEAERTQRRCQRAQLEAMQAQFANAAAMPRYTVLVADAEPLPPVVLN